MTESTVTQLVRSDNQQDINYYAVKYLDDLKQQYRHIPLSILKKTLISELNYEVRKEMKSSELVGFKVRIGDVCYVDFGKSFINEAGFQHFGLVVALNNSKAFIIPMSSNQNTYVQSYCAKTYPYGKKHLMRLGEVKGMHKQSVLFLNDAKFINTARVIEVKAHLSPNSSLFKEIKRRLKECLALDE